MKKNLKPEAILSKQPVVLVSVGTLEKSNIISVAWTGIISTYPPIVYVAVRKERFSHDIIVDNKEFVINIPEKKFVNEVDFCGTKSGKDVDKFKECKFTKGLSQKVKTPSIKECPINIECKLIESKEVGSHTMFIGEIVNISCEEVFLNNEKILFEEMNLLSFANKKYFSNSNIIANRGICLDK